MYSKFPFSFENLPRQKSFACLSLKFGCIFSGLLLILYSVLGLGQCIAALGMLKETDSLVAAYTTVIVAGLVHFITMLLTTVMLVGVIREYHRLMKPWVVWTSCQLMACLLLFIFWTTLNMLHHIEMTLVAYFVNFMTILVRFYILVLVASYCKDLEEQAISLRLKTLMNDDEPRYSAV